MKKFIALVCMITCLLGLTACGSEPNYTAYQQQKVDYAKDIAVNQYLSMMQAYASEEAIAALQENTAEELEYLMQSNYGFYIDGYALISGAISFEAGLEAIGEISSTGAVTATVDDKEIIVEIEVTGDKKNAIAQIIVSNDLFLKLESAALNPVDSFGESMQKAALNTLIGMGSVFVVLILISLIISAFSLIPKIQAKMAGKETVKAVSKEAPKAETTGVDKAVAQIVKQETAANLVNDLELVAVIAAAIAASEGATSTDGFVVRSIIRRKAL